MWRYLLLLFGAALVGSLLYWQLRAEDLPPEGLSAEETVSARAEGMEAPARSFARKAPPPAGRSLYDPVLISSCTLVPAREQEVSSLADGTLREILVDLGSPVAEGQALGRLDDRQLRPQVELLRIKAASRAAERIAKAQYDEADGKVRYARKANENGLQSVSELEYHTYLAQRERFAQEMQKAREDQQAAQKELERAQELLDQHTLRSQIAGTIVKVYKRPGEAVRPSEALFRVANGDRLRVEGLCKVQQANLLRAGMRALVEPEQRGEQMTELRGHTGSITSLAVATDGRLVASASEDHTVLLWNWPWGSRRALLTHPEEVHAVAFLPGGKGSYRLVTGCADGQVRLWTVFDQGKVEGPVLLPGRHHGAVRAVAVSPDGRFCASGGEDRRLGLREIVAAGHWAWLAADAQETAHQGAVTSVHFTPDGFLVSAGRDNTLRIWKRQGSTAHLEGEQKGRTGDVAQLGISPDGRRLLFDQGEELRFLSRDGATLGSLHGNHGRFQGLALFAPSGRLLLTGAANGRIQLWKTPTNPEDAGALRQAYRLGFDRASLLSLQSLAGSLVPTWAAFAGGRSSAAAKLLPHLWDLDGHEIRHFIAPSTTLLTAAAFGPDGRIVFTGGSDKVVRVWAVPSDRQGQQPLEAEITVVGTGVERGTDMVRIRAELPNPADRARRLRPGTYVNLRIYPESAREE